MPTYNAKPWDRKLQDFNHRMSNAFSWSQDYRPSAKEIDSQQRKTWSADQKESAGRSGRSGTGGRQVTNIIDTGGQTPIATSPGDEARRKRLVDMGLLPR